MTTYFINTRVGCSHRWIPSEEAAREVCRAEHETRVKQDTEDGEDPPGDLTFVDKFEDDGVPVPRYLEVLEGGYPVAWICQEPPAWPEVGGPVLTMRIENTKLCPHVTLVCRMDGDPRKGGQRPLIVCAHCGTEWRPEVGS